jgi:DNA-binding SARP family transcriptional activator
LGLLGPLVVADDHGTEIAVPARKERAVLEFLALNVGAVVPRSQIIEALWWETPPLTADKIVQTYVSALRKKLPAGLIETVDAAYCLRLAPDDVDAVCFERLLRAGHDFVEAGDLNRAVACLTDALALWRGEPLVDLADQPVGTAKGRRLIELRLSGEEDLFEARLRLGEHGTAIGDLEAAVDAEPLRERRWAQLMLALYRSGRQADSLHAYGRLRTHLGEQLGIEPTGELRQLEEAIVLQKPELDWQPPPPPRHVPAAKPAPAATHQCPHPAQCVCRTP